ncbi:cobyrinate a,c-diamide synthase [Catenovulum sp. SM1970]|nr:cobyrinate a,c-diamide synthase [Marinifaba aquimaris]
MKLCPALIISAPSSGSGKTTITAALARYYQQQGKIVHVFKTGPDFIDPMILTQASGFAVKQLDLWMVGKDACQALLAESASQADLILIEGVMGLFDGQPSTADLAAFFDIPVLAVIDASAMAQTFGAIACGLKSYRQDFQLAGVIANRIASQRHGQMLADSMLSDIDLVAQFNRQAEITLPERHLGLVQAKELADIDDKLNLAAQQIAQSRLADFSYITKIAGKVQAKATNSSIPATQTLKGKTILVAKDLAFNFLYQENLNVLRSAGAELIFISPLNDKALPQADALYLPGGYPELYAEQLSQNEAFIQSLKAFAYSQKPILAECGGMLYLLEQLKLDDGTCIDMSGVLPGSGQMHKRISSIGMQGADFSLLTGQKHQLTGHSYHYSSAEINLPIRLTGTTHPYKTHGENIYWQNNILASYIHWYFASNPDFVCSFFNANIKTRFND